MFVLEDEIHMQLKIYLTNLGFKLYRIMVFPHLKIIEISSTEKKTLGYFRSKHLKCNLQEHVTT